MNDYDIFSQYYDELIGDKTADTEKVMIFIKESEVKGKDLLDVACGTGSTLKYFFEKGFNVMGVDISEGMLSSAKEKLPNIHFKKMSMTKLELDQSFDVITCLFDSVNHLLDFEDWKKFFDKSYEYLNKDGVFIFDMNSLPKLEKLSQNNPIEKTIKDKTLIMKVTNLPNDIFNWNVQILKNNINNSIEKYEENIKETSFEIETIKDYLLKTFKSIKIVDTEGLKPNYSSKRVYFVCKK